MRTRRNIPILQYCFDQAVDSKVDGSPGDVKTKAVYTDAIEVSACLARPKLSLDERAAFLSTMDCSHSRWLR